MPSTLALAHALKTRLTDERTHSVLNLALPAVGEQLLNMLVGLADTFMVGHLGASAVAAVGLSNQAVMLVTTFFAAVATGVTALVARHIGARETRSAEGILGGESFVQVIVAVEHDIASLLVEELPDRLHELVTAVPPRAESRMVPES